MDNGAACYRRFLDGDDEGIVEIIRDYKDGLMMYLNSITGNFSTAEEIMEYTFSSHPDGYSFNTVAFALLHSEIAGCQKRFEKRCT